MKQPSKPTRAQKVIISAHKLRPEVFTITEGPIKVGSGRMYKLKSGLYITAAEKYVSVYEK